MKELNIRKGSKEDIPMLMQMIMDLAEFEKAPEMVENNEEKLLRDWEKRKDFDFLVAEYEGIPAGISLYYPRYSTWKGPCMYLEDLFVKPEFRKKGIGLQLLRATAEEARKSGAGRLDWQVLDWNEGAVKFYEREGAFVEKEWWNCKMKL